MATDDVVPVGEFRTQLTAFLARVSADRRARVRVGARRRAEAVLMHPGADVPPRIQQRLVTGFVARTADLLVRDAEPEHLGIVAVSDAGGEIFAWLWRTNPDDAVLRMAELMAEIHIHHPTPRPDITFEAVLAAFERAMPYDFTHEEYSAFSAECRARVPAFYAQVNNPPTS
ncbi:hypothetical protein [Mycolicibacterium fortuitum]|uniref:hypothetical protein n=1 Tax=Mycolicibacterium fortuitum TaxID=1766 RepID=UPI00077390CB|nr:hypothetical protein [Mycolicibacterium fortuitum]MDV7193289.1 hypothetical protein [Mycolicibacterium fortuitum]MDV7259859.1 hypothetical protein [Mycolicibacterium fortuitum]MDV7306798.1 hypothetical protein [Mycolicibacterium fortuitum]MDV7313055.1 hypothetical protein [Mycolicibacterium fortuitum]